VVCCLEEIVENEVAVAEAEEQPHHIRRGVQQRVRSPFSRSAVEQVADCFASRGGSVEDVGTDSFDATSPVVGLKQMRTAWRAVDRPTHAGYRGRS